MTYAWGSWRRAILLEPVNSSLRACCMADAYLSVTMNLKTSSSRGAQRRGDFRLPRVSGRRKWQGLHDSRQRRLPRRFAPRNDENLGSSKINNLRMGFMERSAALLRSPDASSYNTRSRRLFPPFTRGKRRLPLVLEDLATVFGQLFEAIGDRHVAALLAMTSF
jgi:hypothetical protein